MTALPVTIGAARLSGEASCTASVTGAATVVDAVSPGTVTSTRIVDPTSSGPSARVEVVSPAIVAQLAPFASQRCHAYANDPFRHAHVPGLAVSVERSVETPAIEGAVNSTGLKLATTGVMPDAAMAVPASFDAVTVIRNVDPASPLSGTYEVPFALAICRQLDPSPAQRLHRARRSFASLHVPRLAVRGWPATASPVIVGGSRLPGGTSDTPGESASPEADTPDWSPPAVEPMLTCSALCVTLSVVMLAGVFKMPTARNRWRRALPPLRPCLETTVRPSSCTTSERPA